MPNNSPTPITKQGCFDNDATTTINDTFVYTLISNAVPVSLTNPTSATDMMTGIIKGGTVTTLGEGLDIFAAGTYNLGAASTMVFTVKLGGVTIATITTASNANTAVTLNWNLTLKVVCGVITNANSLTFEAHGFLNYDGGATLAAAASVFNDVAVAASSGIDPTLDQTLEIMANLGSGNASSNVTERMLVVSLIN